MGPCWGASIRSIENGARARRVVKCALKHFFHEVKMLVVFSFDRSGQAVRKTFHATQARVDEFRDKVALETKRRGAAMARTLIFLGDGAPWVWKTAAELFPK